MKNTQQHTPNISISDDVFVQVFFNNIYMYMFIYIHICNITYYIRHQTAYIFAYMIIMS